MTWAEGLGQVFVLQEPTRATEVNMAADVVYKFTENKILNVHDNRENYVSIMLYMEIILWAPGSLAYT